MSIRIHLFHLSPRTRDQFRAWQGEAILTGLALLGGVSRMLVMRRLYRALLVGLVKKTQLFDRMYYLEQNAEAFAGASPLRHYVTCGDQEGRWPMPLFDPAYYRAHTAGWTKNVNSLLHYFYIGRYRHISPSPWFDVDYYLTLNKDVWRSGNEPIRHYLERGGLEGRSPNLAFDGTRYLHTHPELLRARINPLLHHLQTGRGFGGDLTAEENRSLPPLEPPEEDAFAHVHPRNSDEAARVDVIVPVYKGYTETLSCLLSVLRNRNETPFELIVIDDAGPEPRLSSALQTLADRGLFTLLRNSKNLGFVASVNCGMRLHPDRDVVLLNSDTQVYNDWLDRLRVAAHRDHRTATVTPLSNNATICSYPVFLHDNPWPLDIPYAELDRMAARVNAGVSVEAPTGVGFCLYIRRTALNDIGYFDEHAFGKGYGEENDFCQRAIARGWKNLLTADVFVWHLGGASFGGERVKRSQQALKILAKRHPGYDQAVRDFIRHDPLAEPRSRLDWMQLKAQVREENVLIVCHDRGGGAERYLKEATRRLLDEGKGVFFMRPVRGMPTHVWLHTTKCRRYPNLERFALSETQTLAGRLKELNITTIHSHGLVDFARDAAEHLLAIAHALDVPLDVDIHDYKVICPRLNLVDRGGMYCGEPMEAAACDACLKRRGNDFGEASIVAWRTLHHRELREARHIWVPNQDVAERLNRYYPDVTFTVVPHEEIDFTMTSLRGPEVNPGDKLRIVVIGAIGKLKGFDVVQACAQDAKQRDLPLHFLIMGHSINDRALRKAGVQITGMYQEETPEILHSLQPHVVFLPSLSPETYSYTLSLALKAGLPVFAFDLGAIAERLKALGRADHLQPLDRARHPHQINQQFMNYRAMHRRDRTIAASGQDSCQV